MPITVTVRTVSGAVATVEVESTTTIKELKAIITEKCGLGFTSTLVYKGSPLKKDDATLEDIKYQTTDSIVGVFKKEAPKPAAAPATPAVDATPAKAPQPVTPVSAPDAPIKKAQAPAPVAPKPPQVEWECPTCTYINIPARTLCEMCMSEDPAKAKNKKPVAARDQVQVPQEAIEQQLAMMATPDMDEESKAALRLIIEDDLRDAILKGDEIRAGGDMNDIEEITIDIEDLLKKAEEDPEAKKQFCKEFGLPETATIDELRQKILESAAQDEDEILDPNQIAQLMQDPQVAAQFQQLLQQFGGDVNDPNLQQALIALLAGGLLNGEGELDEEDDEDFDESMMGDF